MCINLILYFSAVPKMAFLRNAGQEGWDRATKMPFLWNGQHRAAKMPFLWNGRHGIFETPMHNWGIRGKSADELSLNYKINV
jgi:hypothetical protein